jgi:5'-methylthioinosine phosphorylase
VLSVELAGHRIPCIARHGEGHAIAPHAVNYRANLWLLHQHGVRRCIAVNAVGGIASALEPGGIAVPAQLIDYTWGRAHSFHEPGEGREVAHVDFAEPFDAALRSGLIAAGAACGEAVSEGVYGVTQGPRLETAAEIDRMERDGCTMVGMTAMPEAGLARELGLGYAICAVIVNRAAGRGPKNVSIHSQLERHMAAGMQRARRLLERAVPALRAESGRASGL